jgi:hypothetical protein
MSILFEQRETGDWAALYLDAEELFGEGGLAAWAARRFFTFTRGSSPVAIRRVNSLPGECWALLTSPEAHVHHNAQRVLLGLVVLADRDEIRVTDALSPQGRRFYFSAQSMARVEPAPAGLASCPRCKLPIDAQSPAIRCPRCRAWHHQRDDRPCWTYADRCASCHDQDTSPDGHLSWTPEEI